jgi:short-subunit dehydrogenase
MNLKERYGPVALIAGASEGMGAAFAHALARQGLNLVIVARRKKNLETLARELSNHYPVEVWPVNCDLAAPDATGQIRDVIGDLKINFLVYNAALSYIGPYLDNPVSEHIHMAEVNMLTPLKMLHHFGSRMMDEKRGGIVLMSSLAGNQGSGFLATYAATKAFNRILSESLWYEWKTKGIDVIGCCAGATMTPNYIQSNPKKISKFAPKPQLPQEVVDECLSRIGKTPSFISGRSNKIASFLMNHIFSLKRSINIMGDTTRKMYGIRD